MCIVGVCVCTLQPRVCVHLSCACMHCSRRILTLAPQLQALLLCPPTAHMTSGDNGISGRRAIVEGIAVHAHNAREVGARLQICEGIIIPNVRFREDDEDDFENNYKEFLRRDLEGSDSETRRRCAADFVRTLVDRFPAETTQIVTQYINTLLAQYAADPAGQWATKNCALYMVMALAVRGKTLAAGATTVNELVDFEAFCREHVLPEIATDDVNARPVLKADALRCAPLVRGVCRVPLAVSVRPMQRHR